MAHRIQRATNRQSAHRGVTVVEFAITAPLVFLLMIGMIVAGLGSFRFQQIAHLAREGARYAAVRGPKYQKRTGQPAATSADVLANAIQPMAAGLDLNALDCVCTMDDQTNTVTVALHYHWLPEAYLPESTLSSTSVMSLEQ